MDRRAILQGKGNINGGAAKLFNKRSDVIKIGDRLLVGSWRPELGLGSGLWGQEASCLGKAMVQRHQVPLQFDEATVVVHQSPPKNAKKGNRRMELVSICQDGGLQLRISLAGCSPRCSSMQFSNRRLVLQRHSSSQDQHWKVIQDGNVCVCSWTLEQF